MPIRLAALFRVAGAALLRCLGANLPSHGAEEAPIFVPISARPDLPGKVTQNWLLHLGWNAIYVEVDPDERRAEILFARDTSPVTRVWTWNVRLSSIDFIQSPEEGRWNRSQWLGYFNPQFNEDQAVRALSDLRSITGRRACLVKVSGTKVVPFSLTGRVSLRPVEWAPDAYNLRGLPVDPRMGVSFYSYFKHSPSHSYRDAATGLTRLLKEVTQLWQPAIYRQNDEGDTVLEQPGYPVLVTNPALFSQFEGVAVRDGTRVGRISKGNSAGPTD